MPDAHWWHETPSLEYGRAFDLCAVEVNRRSGPVAVLASSPFYAREIANRLINRKPLFFIDSSGQRHIEEIASGLEGVRFIQSANGNHDPLNAMIWAKPNVENELLVKDLVEKHFAPGGILIMLANGWMARFLAPQKEVEDTGRRFNRIDQLQGWLARNELQKHRIYGIYGLQSFLWGALAARALWYGRPDLSDRCFFEMRERLVVSGWRARLAALTILVAQRT